MYDHKKMIATLSIADLKAINRTSTLELIRTAGPISRTEIASQLQVSLPTVMRNVDELIAVKLVRSANRKQWTGGRRRDLVEFNGSEHLVIGVDLGGTKFYGALADLTGKLLFETNFEHGQSTAEESFEVLCQSIQQQVQLASQTGLDLLGIAVGVPGITHSTSGMVTHAPSLGWTNFPLKQRLGEFFQQPIVVENDVNLAVLGEFCFGTEPGEENIVLIAIGTGIGAGVVINGVVYTGAHDMAGEVGYLLPDPNGLYQTYPGFGAFEQLASGPGIANRARKLLQSEWPEQQLAAITAEDVFSAARGNQPWARKVIDETIDYLAQAISAICLIVDPHIILLGGGVSMSADLLIEPVRALLSNVVPVPPRLASSRLGYRATVLGGVARIMRQASGYCTLLKQG
jgi:glucokinase